MLIPYVVTENELLVHRLGTKIMQRQYVSKIHDITYQFDTNMIEVMFGLGLDWYGT